jgi:hypothetical protein
MKSVKNFDGRYSTFSNCNFFLMTHVLIVQVGVPTRLRWLDSRHVH